MNPIRGFNPAVFAGIDTQKTDGPDQDADKGKSKQALSQGSISEFQNFIQAKCRKYGKKRIQKNKIAQGFDKLNRLIAREQQTPS